MEAVQVTRLLDRALERVRQLSEDEFDQKIAATADKLDWLIDEAEADFHAGRTEELVPEHL